MALVEVGGVGFLALLHVAFSVCRHVGEVYIYVCMYVCVCNTVSNKKERASVYERAKVCV